MLESVYPQEIATTVQGPTAFVAFMNNCYVTKIIFQLEMLYKVVQIWPGLICM